MLYGIVYLFVWSVDKTTHDRNISANSNLRRFLFGIRGIEEHFYFRFVVVIFGKDHDNDLKFAHRLKLAE